MATSKQTTQLAQQLRSGGAESFEVVVELKAPAGSDGPPGPEVGGAQEAAFERAAQPVIAAIEGTGGLVQAALWINDTIYAVIDRGAVASLEDLDEVVLIDVPGQIVFEGR